MGVWLGLALLLGACQSPTPVKIPQVSAPLQSATATPVPSPTPVLLPAGSPVASQPEDHIFHAADPAVWVEAVSQDPKTLDPALSYETVAGNILSRVYDPLITYEKDRAGAYVPALAETVPTHENGGISADGRTYTFQIRAGVRFQDGSALTAGDVAYSFQRGLLQGGTSGPQWLLTEAFFGPGVDDIAALVDPLQPPYDDRERLSAYPAADLENICLAVKEAIRADDVNRTVTFQLKQPWAPFLATLPGSWGSITSQAWVRDHGGWDGDCAGWQRYYGASAEETLNAGFGRSAMGTGPYRMDHWTPGQELVLAANDDYWRQEPAWEGGPSGAARIKSVTIRIVPEYSTRLTLLQNGLVDFIEVPRGEEALLDPIVGETCDARTGSCTETEHSGQPIRQWNNISPSSRLDVFFTFDLNLEDNPYTGSGRLDGDGIPANFFNDIAIRRAFAFCFNGEKFQQAVYKGTGVRAAGLIPPGFAGFQPGLESYSFDPEQCAAEFKAAKLQSADGRGVWETGFRMAIAYPSGNTAFQTIAQIWQQELAQVNPKFVISVTGIPWQVYVNGQINRQIPIFYGRWVADIADPHNWVVPYTSGCFAIRQGLPAGIKNQYRQLADLAARTPDLQQREILYAELNHVYYENATALLLYQAPESVSMPRYVQGYTPNPFLPGTVNWYSIHKE